MKKNSRLICLLVAVLLATTMLSGVASAKNENDEDIAIKGNLYVMPTSYTNLDSIVAAQKKLNFNVVLYQDESPELTNGSPNTYYDGLINLKWFGDADKYLKTKLDSDKNVKDIFYFLTESNTGVICEPEYLTIVSDAEKVIKVNANKAKYAADPSDATEYISKADSSNVTLEYMSEDNMIDWLYNGLNRDESAGMKPGTATITITGYVEAKDADGNLLKKEVQDVDADGKPLEDADGNPVMKEVTYLVKTVSRSFKITVGISKWQDVEFFPNDTDYLPGDKYFPYDTPFVTEDNGEYYLYLSELDRMTEVGATSWMTKDKGYTFPISMLGDFHVDPDWATYQVGLYSVDNTAVANIHNNLTHITIRTTGDFNLKIEDKDGLSKYSEEFKFHVVDARDAVDEIVGLKFTTPVYNGRERGQIIDLDTYAIVTRHESADDKDHEYRLDTDFDWNEDWFINLGKYVRSGINTSSERFTVNYTSSDEKVAKVFNKADIYDDPSPSWDSWMEWKPLDEKVTDSKGKDDRYRLAIWSVEDKQYVFPHEGTVLITGPGDATITCTITNQKGKSVSASVLIHVNGEIPTEPVLTGITADEEINLYTGNTQLIDYELEPAGVNAEVTFETSNKDVALVNKAGRVTAGKDGECEITVTAKQGDITKTAKVKVLVIGNSTPVVIVEKNGLIHDTDGKFRYYEKNELVKKTGIVPFCGAEFWVVEGELAADATGLTLCPDGKWYFLESGRILRVTQGASYNKEYFFVNNGELDTKKNGLCDYDGGKFLIAEGHFIKYNGLWLNPEDGKWYFLADGQWDPTHDGVVEYDHRFFVVEDGILDTSYNGTVVYDKHTFFVQNGQLWVSPID